MEKSRYRPRRGFPLCMVHGKGSEECYSGDSRDGDDGEDSIGDDERRWDEDGNGEGDSDGGDGEGRGG